MTAKAFAPAKINLTLHVTGQRADGYHLLDSLVVFADVGDWVTVTRAAHHSLAVTGGFAADVPQDDSNLVVKAAQLVGGPPVSIALQKDLPAASGIGGGSSDAAATLRALSDLLGVPVPVDVAVLGADVPVCLLAQPARMSGIGDRVKPLADLPALHLVLANPGVAVSTPEVFKALSVKQNQPMPAVLPKWQDAADLAQWLDVQRNDLEDPARRLAPAIGVALAQLKATSGCLLARMSGSGATCFGLYASRIEAGMAAEELNVRHPNWWIKPASTWQLGQVG